MKPSEYVEDGFGIERANTELLNVFDRHLAKITFDNKLYESIAKYRFTWATHNADRIEFLGGNSIGTTIVRFTDSDIDTLVIDILDIDMDDLREDVHALDTIDTSRKVTSNVFYLLLMYLMHGFIVSGKISDKNREHAIREVYFIFAYRVISSMFAHYFSQYQLDKNIALVVNEKLSKKFIVKQEGSWQAVFNYRADAVALKNGLHYERLKTFDSEETQIALADLQGRIRDMVKNIYAIIMDVTNENKKIGSTSLHETFEDQDTIASLKDRSDVMIKYTKSIVFKHDDFVKREIVDLVDDLTGSVGNKDLLTMLNFISENYIYMTKEIDAIIEGTLESFMDYIKRRNITNNYSKDITVVVVAIKNYYSNSKINDKNVEDVKKILKNIYTKATGKRNKTAISGARIRVMLYIVIRAIAKNTYK